MHPFSSHTHILRTHLPFVCTCQDKLGPTSICLLTTPQSPPADAAARHFFFYLDLLLELLFSNYFFRTTFLDYYLLYYSIDNTSSTVGHGPAAISLLEGSSEPAVNSVAPLSLTPGSRATSSGTQYRMSCAFKGGCRAQQPTDCTCLGGAHSHRRVMGGGGVGVSVWNRVEPAPLLF